MRSRPARPSGPRPSLPPTILRLLLASCLLLACLRTSSGAIHAERSSGYDPRTLFVAYYAAPQTLEPAAAYDGAGPAVLRGLYDSLVTLQGGSITRIVGDLATSWTSSADKAIWTFALRHGVRFHDGTPVDAAAVKFSYDRLFSINQAPAFIVGQFVTAAGIRVLDPYTIQFRLLPHTATYGFLQALTAQWGNWIVSPTAVGKHTSHGDRAQGWLASHEAGSGPYTLTGYQADQGATLTAFPGYWKGWAGHHVQRVVFTSVVADAARRSILEKGDVDISLNFTPQDLLAMRKEPNLIVGNRYVLAEIFISMTEYGPLASAAARQAMSYAFDYRSFVADILKGFGKPAAGPVPSTVSGHDPALHPYSTDLARAKTLLRQAGIAPGTALTIEYQLGDEHGKQMCLVLQGQLAQLGITLRLIGSDASSYATLLYTPVPAAKRPNFIANFWQPDYNDAIDYLSPLYHSRGATAAGGSNAGDYASAAVDRLLATAADTPDAANRQVVLNRLQETLTYSDPAAIYVADVTENPVYRATVHGFVINPELNETYDYYSLWKSL